jgi:hypothetical protein
MTEDTKEEKIAPVRESNLGHISQGCPTYPPYTKKTAENAYGASIFRDLHDDQ